MNCIYYLVVCFVLNSLYNIYMKLFIFLLE
jgi:hypothetical protein